VLEPLGVPLVQTLAELEVTQYLVPLLPTVVVVVQLRALMQPMAVLVVVRVLDKVQEQE
jgi:hypothetical protein